MIFVRLIRSVTGLVAEKEYKFHPARKWRFDYAIPAIKMAIEVEGGVWTGGRHTSGKGFLNDMEKYNEAALMGWCLIRTTPDRLLTSKVLDLIKRRKEEYERENALMCTCDLK